MQALNKKTFRPSETGKPLHLHWLLPEIPKDSKSGRMESTVKSKSLNPHEKTHFIDFWRTSDRPACLLPV
jgi:hypothetical protein